MLSEPSSLEYERPNGYFFCEQFNLTKTYLPLSAISGSIIECGTYLS